MAALSDETPTIAEVFDAIRAHRIRRVTTESWWRTLAVMFFIFVQHPILVRWHRAGLRRANRSTAEPLRYPAADEGATV